MVKTKGRDFSGRKALELRHASENRWQMVMLKIESGVQDPFYAHSLFIGDEAVGIVTSGAYGHRTGLTLALAYLRNTSKTMQTKINDGLQLEVQILKKRYKAHILKEIPFDASNKKMKELQ